MKSNERITKHHRLPRHKGGTNTPENISMLPENLHRAWHVLFKTYDAIKIAEVINKFYLDPAYTMVAHLKKKKKDPNQISIEFSGGDEDHFDNVDIDGN